MSWSEEPPIPISALQHYVYCPRQCALIHLEQTFDENIFTLRGNRAHERVDVAGSGVRGGRTTLRALPLWSDRLRLIGKADVVEVDSEGALTPIEHKSGPRKIREADDIQVCAQALCLEEMTGRSIPRGAIFHHASKRRREVLFTLELRARTETITSEVGELLRQTRLPPPVADARCRNCSLIDACLPFEIQRLTTEVARAPRPA